MYKLGEKVRYIAQEGIYEIIASKESPKKIVGENYIPTNGSDYAIKRTDGYMSSNFEPYIEVYESMIEKNQNP